MTLTSYLLGINILSFVAHVEDKLAAKGWLPFFGRVPEVLLHQIELAGGSVGSFLGQRALRHKISKVPYQRGFCQVLGLQVVAGFGWAYYNGFSWALAGAEATAITMLGVCLWRIYQLNYWWRRRKNGQHQNWQRPVSAK